jgi:uncharacterized repeat protein (TIGR03803 family)
MAEMAPSSRSRLRALTTITSYCIAFCGELEGQEPQIQATNGNFYGANGTGGTHNAGTVFKMTPQGVVTTLYNFCSKADCADGTGSAFLTQAANGSFYGLTSDGGSHGTLFKMLPAGKLTTLHTFCVDLTTCLDGDGATGPLVQGADGDLYGVNHVGGAAGGGTIFKTTTAGQFTTLYNFCGTNKCADGSLPSVG